MPRSVRSSTGNRTLFRGSRARLSPVISPATNALPSVSSQCEYEWLRRVQSSHPYGFGKRGLPGCLARMAGHATLKAMAWANSHGSRSAVFRLGFKGLPIGVGRVRRGAERHSAPPCDRQRKSFLALENPRFGEGGFVDGVSHQSTRRDLNPRLPLERRAFFRAKLLAHSVKRG